MTIPDKVKIGPLDWKIEWVDELELDGQRCHGAATFLSMLIEVDSRQPLLVRQVTLLHEIMHGILEESGVGDMLGDKKEEMVVRTLSLQLIHAMHENREVGDFLMLPKE